MMINRIVSSSELDEEDCSYVLRELELNAFSSVVAAFRAQGMLNKFKEVVLDRLRQALCVSDEEMKMEMKKSADDECLKHIAELLNPSYDTYSQWALLGFQAPADFIHIPSRQIFESQSSLTAADDLLFMASKHNDSIDENNDILASLMQMPGVPYVPERLRGLLRESESLHKERIIPRQSFEEQIRHEPTAKLVKPPTKSRRRRSKPETYVVEEDVKKEVNDEVDSSFKNNNDCTPFAESDCVKQNVSQNDPALLNQENGESSVLLGLIPNTKEAENLGVKDLLSKIQKQIQEEEEAKSSTNNDNMTRRKRRPKQSQSSNGECARARPFQFSPASNGVKPPRGNPDKRPPKRSPGGSGNLRFSPPIPPSPNTVLPISTFQQHDTDSPSCSTEHSDQNPPKEIRLPVSPPAAINSTASSKTSQNFTNSVSLPVSFSPISKSPTHSSGSKRPRVTSFHEEKPPSLIKISRTNLVSLSPSSSVTKLKLVTSDSNVSMSLSTCVPSNRVIFASPTTTINRMAISQLRSASTPMPLINNILPPVQGPSRSSLSPTPSTLEGSHGHDYGSSGTAVANHPVGANIPGQRTIYKRNVLKTGGIRVTANGVYSSHPSSSYKTVSSNEVIPSKSCDGEFLPYCETPKMERKDTILGRRVIALSSTVEKYHDDHLSSMFPSGSEKRIVRPVGERIYTFQGPSSGMRSSPITPRLSISSYSHSAPLSLSCSPSGYDEISSRLGNQVKPVGMSSSSKIFDVVPDKDSNSSNKNAYITQERIPEESLNEHPVMDILQQSMMEIS